MCFGQKHARRREDVDFQKNWIESSAFSWNFDISFWMKAIPLLTGQEEMKVVEKKLFLTALSYVTSQNFTELRSENYFSRIKSFEELLLSYAYFRFRRTKFLLQASPTAGTKKDETFYTVVSWLFCKSMSTLVTWLFLMFYSYPIKICFVRA